MAKWAVVRSSAIGQIADIHKTNNRAVIKDQQMINTEVNMALNEIVRIGSMPFSFCQRAIEEQIHKEFQGAFDELERASGQEKIEAAGRLNRAVRKLYDFVGYGKMPHDLQFKRPKC
jgi:hypothetical protein